MSSNQRIKRKAIKRRSNSPTNVGKRQKLLRPHNGIIPVTATTREVLFKKLNPSNQDLQNQQFVLTLPNESAKNVRSARKRKLSDVKKYSPKNIKSPCKFSSTASSLETINVSQMCKYSPVNIKSPCSSSFSPVNGGSQCDLLYVGKSNSSLGPDIGEKHRKSLPGISSTPLPSASAKNMRSARNRKLSDVKKYSPKNIKSPCKDSSTSSSLQMINVSQMCKYSPENIELPSPGKNRCQGESYVGKRNSLLGPDIGNKHRKSFPDINSTPSPSFSKTTLQKKECNSFQEEDPMLSFFKSLLPYTAGLSEEQKNEFKIKVVQWLKTTVSTTLEDLLDE